MIDLKWVKLGRNLLLFAVLIALPISFFLPIFGSPFLLVFSDAVLLGLSAIVVGLIAPTTRIRQLVLLILIWIAASLALEIPRIAIGNSTLLRSNSHPVHVLKPRQTSIPPTTVTITGPANPIASSRGYWWEVEPDVHMLGVRQSMGRPLANMVSTVDLPDMLWARGIEPRIGGDTYPRLSINHVFRSLSSELKLEYLEAPGQVSITYSRQLPMPPAYPGSLLQSPVGLVASIFHFNFWSSLAGTRKPVDLRQDVSYFLDTALGSQKSSSESRIGPLGNIEFEQETIEQVSAGQNVTRLFQQTNTTYRQISPGKRVWEVCGKSPEQLDFGGPGYSAFIWGMANAKDAFPVLLRKFSPDDGILAFYCDTTKQHIVVLSRLGTKTKPIMRISVFDIAGKLLSVKFFQLPRWLDRGSLVIPDSWKVDSDGVTTFQMMERIRWVNKNHREEEDQNQYRLLSLKAK